MIRLRTERVVGEEGAMSIEEGRKRQRKKGGKGANRSRSMQPDNSTVCRNEQSSRYSTRNSDTALQHYNDEMMTKQNESEEKE